MASPGSATGLGGDAQSKGGGGLQRVHDVQVVGPALGEVLPRVGAGVAADEPLLPVRRRTLGVVSFETDAIVLALVAEQHAEPLQPNAVSHQPLPIVVTDLAAEVSEQRAVGLPHFLAGALALGVVGLGDVDGDQPLLMAGQDFRAVR